MFFQKIILSNDITKRFPRYGLFMYGEGYVLMLLLSIKTSFNDAIYQSYRTIWILAMITTGPQHQWRILSKRIKSLFCYVANH